MRLARRDFLALSTAVGASPTSAIAAETRHEHLEYIAKEPKDRAFPIGLNTATLRGHKLPIVEVIDIAARAGYQGIEPWVDELDRYVEAGGTLKELDQRLKDHGLKVTGAIAFFAWMIDDQAERRRAFDEARRRMEQLAQIGATHVAAPPAGDVGNVDLLAVAERYRELLEMARPFGVTPAVEIWGGAANVSHLGQAVLIAIESHHPKACILPDVFHLHRGGSDLADVAKLNPKLLAGFHLNDYPADPPREKLTDKDRVFPGDGIAPLRQLIRNLRQIGYTGSLSVELFNPAYYQQDPTLVARTALEKTQGVIRSALDNM